MSEENVTTSASISSRSRPCLKRQCKNSVEPGLIKTPKQLRKRNLKVAAENEGKETKAMLLTDLPNEILRKILNQISFDDLFNLEIVCKRLQKVVKGVVWPMKDSFNQESIFKYTNYPLIPPNFINYQYNNVKEHNITNKSVEAILSRTNNIQNIDLSIYSLTLNEEVCSLLSMAPKLIKLNLSFLFLKNANLVTIAHSCPMLEEISLECCFTDEEEELNDGLKTLFKQCPNIKYMNLAENTLGNFFEFLPLGLLYLNIGHCNFTSYDMYILAQRVPNLETLILDFLNSDLHTTDMNIWLSKLTKLRFLKIDNITPRPAIPSLDFSNLHELEKLCLCANDLFETSTVESLQNCPKLKSLDLSYNSLDKSRAFEMLKNCNALKYFSFSKWYYLNDDLINFVQHNQIEYLNLGNCDHHLTINLIKSLVNYCESLNYLIMWSPNSNYGEILKYIHSDIHSPPRKNILKIIVHYDTKISSSSSSCKWCEVIPWKSSDTLPFSDFTNVQIQ